MWIEAILTTDDLLDVFRKLSPLEIRLGDSGSVNLSTPTAVSTIADKGVSVVCDATLHFPVLGIDVPVHMRGLTVEIHPSVQDLPDGAGQALVFALQIDRTGVTILPHLLDEGVTKLVNEELVKKHVQLAWNFHETLSHVFRLPDVLSASTLGLRVTGGSVKVTGHALGLAVGFETDVQKRKSIS